MGDPLRLRIMDGAGCHSGLLRELNEKPESLKRLRPRRRKRPAQRQAPSLVLLVELGGNKANHDHDAKKATNDGENGAVKTSHVILLAFGTLFQK